MRGSRDKAFAMKTMGKYFRTDDRDVLEETYEAVVKGVINLLPYPERISALLQDVESLEMRARRREFDITPVVWLAQPAGSEHYGLLNGSECFESLGMTENRR